MSNGLFALLLLVGVLFFFFFFFIYSAGGPVGRFHDLTSVAASTSHTRPTHE